MLPPGDPLLAKALNELGGQLRARGRPEESRKHLERALRMYETTYGARHPEAGQVMGNLASTLADLGLRDESLAMQAEAIEVLSEGFGPEHVATAIAIVNYSATLPEERWEEALQGYERAEAIYRKAYGSDHPEVGIIAYNSGTLLALHGRLEEAQRAFFRTIDIWSAAYGADAPMLGIAWGQLAAIYAETGRTEDSLDAARTARALCRQPDAPPECEEALSWDVDE
jgi:tetratricopeptide (TPR) repeat protein